MNNEIIILFCKNETVEQLVKMLEKYDSSVGIVLVGSPNYRQITADIRESKNLDVFYMEFTGKSDELESLGTWLKISYPTSNITVL